MGNQVNREYIFLWTLQLNFYAHNVDVQRIIHDLAHRALNFFAKRLRRCALYTFLCLSIVCLAIPTPSTQNKNQIDISMDYVCCVCASDWNFKSPFSNVCVCERTHNPVIYNIRFYSGQYIAKAIHNDSVPYTSIGCLYTSTPIMRDTKKKSTKFLSHAPAIWENMQFKKKAMVVHHRMWWRWWKIVYADKSNFCLLFIYVFFRCCSAACFYLAYSFCYCACVPVHLSRRMNK